MNNSQFRKLVNDTPRADRSSGPGNATSSAPAAMAAPTLGSRQRASIPMTPRSVGFSSSSSSFAQQAAAYRLQQNPPKEKKFKSSAPLGSKLPQGYVDRTKSRDSEDVAGSDDAEQRMAALMTLVEEGSLTREEAIEQSKAFGGDVGSTHLVKGLDFKLLERARKGESLLAGDKDDKGDEEMEDELDKALEKEVETAKRAKKTEEDDDDDGAPAPKQKTRAEILAEWKKNKEEAAAKKAAETALGSKFKKFGEKEKRIKAPKEEPTSVKKSGDSYSGKKRKRDIEDLSKPKDAPIVNSTVMGMLPPELPSAKAPESIESKDDDDINIFDDAPDEYDPLAGLQDSDDSDSDEGEVGKKPERNQEMPPPPPPSNRPRNYFSTSSTDAESMESIVSKPLSGQELAHTAELSAAIKKAAQMRELTKAHLDNEEAKKEARHKAMLQAASRDDEDVDMGFGGSTTFGDDDEELEVTRKKKNKKKKA
ncbi:hypothetical protein H072_1972 [Dactylellina haptotyla CBS 200.50]|uniref:RED-like N-terminal domain-containing protein n=1 Tax=Dactylellina haptotyla (strain CBS 200.50) TaxID=1284197 RepID=S8BX44_DACHA|nr:hypothetical protein H072_1972 [Dactylellina haptotyla CBS 200.50]